MRFRVRQASTGRWQACPRCLLALLVLLASPLLLYGQVPSPPLDAGFSGDNKLLCKFAVGFGVQPEPTTVYLRLGTGVLSFCIHLAAAGMAEMVSTIENRCGRAAGFLFTQAAGSPAELAPTATLETPRVEQQILWQWTPSLGTRGAMGPDC